MIANKDLLNQYLIFSENIKRLRKRKNLSISYVKQIESCKGYKNLTLTTMLKLSKALDTTISNLFK